MPVQQPEYASLRQGLVGAWCPSLGASGLTLLDRSGRNNHGTLTNMGGQDNWRASGSGVALNFDGTNDFVSAAPPSQEVMRSMSFWINPNVVVNAASSFGSIFQIRVLPGNNTSYYVSIGSATSLLTNEYLTLADVANGYRVGLTDGGNLPALKWSCITFAERGSSHSIYVNGVSRSVSVANSNTSPTINAIRIGCLDGEGFGPQGFFSGLVDDVRIYNRILTEAEIRLLASRRGIGLTPTRVRPPLKPVTTVSFSQSASSRRVANTTSSLRNGLVGAWCPSLGASGLTLIDRSGQGNHGVLTNMGGQNNWQASGSGVALNFDGTNDFVDLSASAGVVKNTISVTVWFKTTQTTAGRPIVKPRVASSQQAWAITLNAYVANKISFTTDTTVGNGLAGVISSTTSVNDGTWRFAAGTYDGATKRLYVGTVLEATTTGSGDLRYDNLLPLQIGRFDIAGDYFNGQLDDIRIYNRALTPAEIRLLASKRGIGLTDSQVRRPTTQVKPRVTTVAASSRRMSNTTSSLRSGLVGAWCPSLGATGLTLIDRSGRNNHGTLTNMGGQDNWRASGAGVALAFDGTNDYVIGTTSNGFPIGSAARTLSVWFRMSANVNAEFLAYGGNSFNGCRFSLYREIAAGVGVEIGSAGSQAAWTYDTSWHHLATSYDASATNVTACRVFLDGVQLSVTTSSPATVINTVNTPVTIGAISGATTVYNLNGQIDDARIYNRALTPSEIRLLASQRGIGLTDSQVRRPAVDTASTLYLKKDGQWVPTVPYTKSNGVWGPATPRAKTAVAWSPSDVPAAIDPRLIPGLHSWWDASDASSVTLDSGRVSQLADKSGNGRHLTNTTSGSTQPSYITAGRNGLNVARFAAASVQRLSVPSSTATYKFLHDGTPCWWIAVNTFGTVTNPVSYYCLWSTYAASAGVGSYFAYDDGGSQGNFPGTANNSADIFVARGVSGSFVAETMNAGTTAYQSGYANILTPNAMLVSDCLFDVANATASERLSLSVNGATAIKQNAFTNTPSTADATGNMTVGGAIVGGTFYSALQGDICELLFFNQQPTAGDRTLVRQYLAAKWGVTLA